MAHFTFENHFNADKHEYNNEYDDWNDLLTEWNTYNYADKKNMETALSVIKDYYKDTAAIEIRNYQWSKYPHEILVVQWR